MNWLRFNRSLHRPAQIDSALKHGVSNTVAASCLSHSHVFAVDLKDATIALVVGLLQPSGPAAITGLVMPVQIDTVKAVSRWAWPHVGPKCREVIAPAFAHANSSSAIACISIVARIFATLNSARPSVILARVCHAVAIVVALGLEAATATHIASSQRCAVSNFRPAAVTAAIPMCTLVAVGGLRDDNQASETLAGKVNRWHVKCYHATSY